MRDNSPLLLGQRVVLRDWEHVDLAPLLHWLQPERHWRATDGPYFPLPTTERIQDKITMIAKRIDEHDWPTPRMVLPIVVDGVLTGQVSRYWKSEETQWLAMGVSIFDPSKWNKGLAYEGLGLWCEYLFGALPELRRLDLETWSGNIGMMRLARKLGFRQEACFRQARTVRGQVYDQMGYGILRPEWQERYGDGFTNHLAS